MSQHEAREREGRYERTNNNNRPPIYCVSMVCLLRTRTHTIIISFLPIKINNEESFRKLRMNGLAGKYNNENGRDICIHVVEADSKTVGRGQLERICLEKNPA